jgi:hypothetical protein
VKFKDSVAKKLIYQSVIECKDDINTLFNEQRIQLIIDLASLYGLFETGEKNAEKQYSIIFKKK